MRTGIIAKKIGMTRVFDKKTGKQTAVTVLKIDDLIVMSRKTRETDGYNAIQLGCGSVKIKTLTKAQKGCFQKNNVVAKKKLCEFHIDEENFVDTGSQILPSHFVADQFVDITGLSIGKGFAGAMKRHNFGGLRASHGVSVSHRSHGSTGQCQDPGKVFKGKKMAGQMGNVQVTTQNLRIISTNDDSGIILVKGAVPGAKGGWVVVKDAVKKPILDNLPLPAAIANNRTVGAQ